MRVVKAFAREPFEIEKFDADAQAMMARRLAVLRLFALAMPLMSFLLTLSTAIVLLYGGRRVIAGELSLGSLVAFNSYLLMLGQPTQRLGWLVNQAAGAVASGGRIFETLDTPSAIEEKPNAVELPTLRGEVRFDDVRFAYAATPSYGAMANGNGRVDGRSDGSRAREALRGITFEARPNQIVALIGTIGSGKTTIVNLIPRFYDVTGGRVLVDGYDVRDVTLRSLRRQIGIVLQNTFLFSATIKENIAYGRPDASIDEIVAAAEAAHAHEFITSFEGGYDTVIGERGVTLSGGQRQRVAIARALLMDPRILILDDATSSVDTQTEYLIQQALRNLMQGRTTFIIAQRLSTLKSADQILVVHKGIVVEQGTHWELLELGGRYREIYDLQLRDQEEQAQTLRTA